MNDFDGRRMIRVAHWILLMMTAADMACARANLPTAQFNELCGLLARVNAPPAPLLDWIPQVTPEWESPVHLAPLTQLIERSLTEYVSANVATPPQHAKTETTLHGFAWLAKQSKRRHAYATYSDRRTRRVSDAFVQIADRAGLHPTGAADLIKLDGGSSVLFTSRKGGITGDPVDGLLVLDDLIKGRAEANSPAVRDEAGGFVTGSAITRRHPMTSVLSLATRWHRDDPSGRLIKKGWLPVNLPAIRVDGTALWPSQRPLEFLARQRVDVGDADWFSLFMCDPRESGETLFGESVWTYKQLPAQGLRYSIGVDCAYSAKTRADWSAIVVLAEAGAYWYVIDVIRKQCKIEDFVDVLKAVHSRYPHAPMRWHCSTTEMGTAGLLQRLGVPVVGMLAQDDKYTRTQPVAMRWRQRRVLVPEDIETCPWVEAFTGELTSFTGLPGEKDDQADALASGFGPISNVQVPDEHPDQTPDIGADRKRALELMEMAQRRAAQAQRQTRGLRLNTRGA